MDFSEYQKHVDRTTNPNGDWHERLTNFALGISGEAGEFAELVKKHVFHNVGFDSSKARKELGDVLFYVAAAANLVGSSIEEIAAQNVEKLRARYPDGFVEGGGIR